jgi:uridine kinase
VTQLDAPTGTVDTASRIARLVLAAPPRAGTTRVVGIDGPSGAGKTTLAAALSAELAVDGRPAPVVHLDDIYPGWDGLADAVPRLLEWVLEPLAAGDRPRYRRYEWPTGGWAEWHDVPTGEGQALVVDGVSCGARDCARYLSLLVWVEAPEPLRFERGIERDGEAYRPHWRRWARQEDVHFATEGTRERADVVIDGSRGEVARVRSEPGPGDSVGGAR